MRDADFSVLSKRQDVFCPFEALGVARAEIRHANFLSEILSPNGAHGFGESMLRSIVQSLIIESIEKLDKNSSSTKSAKLLLDLHLSDLSYTKVMREWRNLDLVIHIPGDEHRKNDIIIAVELKVESSEHGNQLEQYEISVNDEWPDAESYFFFLTIDGSDASRNKWISVSYQTILSAMDKVILSEEGQPEARRMAKSYISMMERRYMPNTEMEERARRIWTRHRAALNFLIEHEPNAANSLSRDIRKSELASKLNDSLGNSGGKNITFVEDTSTNTHLRFAVKEWDKITGMTSSNNWVASNRFLLLEIAFIKGHSVTAYWVVGRGPDDIRNKIIKKVDPKRSKPVSKEFTRVGSSVNLVTKKKMEEFNESGGYDDKFLHGVISDFVKYALKTSVDYDKKLKGSSFRPTKK